MYLYQIKILTIVVLACVNNGDCTTEKMGLYDNAATTSAESTEIELESDPGIRCHQSKEFQDTFIEHNMGDEKEITSDIGTTVDGTSRVVCSTYANTEDKIIDESVTTESLIVLTAKEEELEKKDKHHRTDEEVLKEKVAEIEAKPVILTARV